jgi:hypothetical protein
MKFNRFPKRGGHNERKSMNTKQKTNEIFMLQYRIKRYQAMGNGIMCQVLNNKLKRLQLQQLHTA